MNFKVGQILNGFKVSRIQDIPELRSKAAIFIHELTKAQVLHIINDDPNNLFCICFRTPVYNNTGVPHILEHSVLSGSKKYPLKDPFKEMMKGSLQTYMNAITYPDKTMYPISSQVEQDYFNLVDMYLDAVFKTIMNGKSWIGEIQMYGTQKEILDILLRAYAISDSNGKVTNLVGVHTDITERKKREKEIINLRNYLSNIIDSMPSIIIGVDTDIKVTQWNKKVENTTGITAEDAHGKVFSDIFPQMRLETKVIKESIQSHEIIKQQQRPRKLNESIIYDDITIYPLITNGVQGAVIRIDDVTDKVRMEETLIQSEKMLSVGGLAAGMAHEINNPLAGIIQTANVISDRLGKMIDMPANVKAANDSGITMEGIKKFMEIRGITRMLKTINKSGERIAGVVNNMLSFARKADYQKSTYNIVDILDNALELATIDYDLKKNYDFRNIKIKKEYENNIPLIPCEKGKIQQVFLNILRNGAQAFQECKIQDSQFIVRVRFQKDRNLVVIEIEDNGPGIDEEIQKRIFEPFYTTKPVGIGTGLGLSVSYFIINENHGGELFVESQLGKGTKFIIHLPIVKNEK